MIPVPGIKGAVEFLPGTQESDRKLPDRLHGWSDRAKSGPRTLAPSRQCHQAAIAAKPYALIRLSLREGFVAQIP